MRVYQQLMILVVMSAMAGYAQARYNPSQLAHFEQTNECVNCDLSSSRINPNHSGADLEGANLSSLGEKLNSGPINFSGANLKNTNMSEAYLEYANFSNANLTGAHLDGAYVKYANFSGAVGVDLKNVVDACSVILPNGKLTKECSA